MEWTVDCGRGLVTAKVVRAVTDMTYLEFGPKADNPRKAVKPLFSGLLWPANGPRVSDMAIVLVQVLCDEVQVPLLESVTPLVHEFDLGGLGAFFVGHWDEGIDGGPL